jgi:Tfp pilus assembly protein PilE
MDTMKLKGATLIESMVAMIVVLLCFGIATMIYVNVMNSDSRRAELHAHLLLNEIAMKAKQQELFLDEEIHEGTLLITKKVETYKGVPGLIRLGIIARNEKDKIIATHNEIICIACKDN